MNKFCVSIFLLSISIGAFAQTITVGSTTEHLTASERGAVATYWPDGNMGAIYHNGTNYVFAPTTGPGTVQITLPNLNTWTSSLSLDTPTTNLTFGAGSNAFDYNYIGGSAVYYDSGSGYLIQLYHGENWFGGGGSPFYSALGLAYSTNFGVTWNKLGEVISPQAARVNGGTNCQAEVGTSTLVPVGSYLYAYYTDTVAGCTGYVQIAVARASISSVIAAAEAGTPFTSGPGTLFMKYTGSGTWNGDGVTDLANPQNGGGAFTAVATDSAGNGQYEPNVRYDSATNSYIMAYIAGSTTSQINAQTSTDGETWGNQQTLVSGGGGFGSSNQIYYPTLFNTSGGDPQTLGEDFSVFYVYPFNAPSEGWSGTNLYSVALSVPGGTDYTLSTATTGTGSGTVAGCAGSYASGASYDCTLTAGSGSTLAGASGCGGTLSGTTYSGNMPASNCTVTATFNSSGGGGTPTYVQAVAAPGAYATNPSTTISITPTAGDTLTVWAGGGGGLSSFNTPTASGLTFTLQGSSSSEGIWTATVPSTQTYTITLSGNASSNGELSGIAVETSGTTTSGIVVSNLGATSGCPSCVGSTLTTTSANSMVLTFMGYGYGPGLTVSSPSPFAFTSVNGDDSPGMYNGAGYYLKSSAGLYSPTWTTSNYPTMPNASVALAASSGSTVTGVSVSCSPTSITTSQTSSCSATVSGTGSPSQSVTWSVSSGSGSVNSSGLFTPSGTGTSTIKATSVQNSSYSGTANVTVTSSGGTPAYVQAVAAPGAYTTNPSTTISITPTAGDTLTVWGVAGGGLTSFNTPTASGLTFTSHGTSIGSSSQGIWTAPVTSTGSYTITISGSSSSTVALAGIAVETSNTTTSGIVLSSFGSASCGSSCTGSSLTTTSANSMVLTFMWYGVGLGSLTSPSPFAFTSVNGGDSGWGMYNGAGYYLKSSTGSYTPTWTASGDPYMPNVSVALAP